MKQIGNILFLGALAIVLTCAYTNSSLAQRRCPAGESGCTIDNVGDKFKERVEEGRKKVNEASNPIDKAKEVGKTVKDCAKCGMDAITKGVHTVQ